MMATLTAPPPGSGKQADHAGGRWAARRCGEDSGGRRGAPASGGRGLRVDPGIEEAPLGHFAGRPRSRCRMSRQPRRRGSSAASVAASIPIRSAISRYTTAAPAGRSAGARRPYSQRRHHHHIDDSTSHSRRQIIHSGPNRNAPRAEAVAHEYETVGAVARGLRLRVSEARRPHRLAWRHRSPGFGR